MRLPAPVSTEPRRFYDGGLPEQDGQAAVAPDPGSDPRILLDRVTEQAVERWALQRRIAYADRRLGEILVPADIDSFRTDLTSVPALFTWLVPRTGAHLPAALLHDGLVHDSDEPASYVSTEGHVVLRPEADRMFRDAMADTGTGLVRRWLVWSAVTTWTMLDGRGTGWSSVRRWRYRLAAAVTLAVILYLGYSATVDLVDATAPLALPLPWMGDRRWWLELVGGLAGAVVVPLVLALAWGRFRAAGVVSGLVLAVLLHVTVAVALLSLGYRVVEAVARRQPLLTGVAAVVGVAASAVVLVATFLGVL